MKPQEFHTLFLQATGSRSGWRWSHGECFLYTYCFIKVVGGEALSYVPKRNGGHCFIKKDNLYFDSENVDGVSNWKNLQRYMLRGRASTLKKHRKPTGIIRTWKLTSEQIKTCDAIILKIKTSQFVTK